MTFYVKRMNVYRLRVKWKTKEVFLSEEKKEKEEKRERCVYEYV